MTLRECIAQHHAAQPPLAALTPLGAATLAARSFALALRELTPEDREYLLTEVVARADAGTHGRGFSLLISHPPVRDPQPA